VRHPFGRELDQNHFPESGFGDGPGPGKPFHHLLGTGIYLAEQRHALQYGISQSYKPPADIIAGYDADYENKHYRDAEPEARDGMAYNRLDDRLKDVVDSPEDPDQYKDGRGYGNYNKQAGQETGAQPAH
jgi:hypothetical protein